MKIEMRHEGHVFLNKDCHSGFAIQAILHDASKIKQKTPLIVVLCSLVSHICDVTPKGSSDAYATQWLFTSCH